MEEDGGREIGSRVQGFKGSRVHDSFVTTARAAPVESRVVHAMHSRDRLPFPRRYLALFLFVFLVPVGVLTALAIQTVNQDRELAVRRAEDDRQKLAAAIRQEFLGRLEGVKLRALAGVADVRPDDRAPDPADSIVLVATIVDRRLVLPWEKQATASEVRRVLAESPYSGLVSSGETEELARQRPAASAALYLRALSSARYPSQAAAAELLLARALGKAGEATEALSYTKRTLARPSALVDEHGVPFAMYAARRAVDLDTLDIEVARAALEVAQRAGSAAWMSPTAVHMAAAVVSTLRTRGPADVQPLAAAAQLSIDAQIDRSEQALALQQTFPALARQFPSTTARGGDPLWLTFGQAPWLVGITADIGRGQPILIAVDAHRVFDGLESVALCAASGGCRLAQLSGAELEGYSFGPALPGLTLLDVKTTAGEDSRRWVTNQAFYIAALSLILILAAFGAYLLWRDVHRELRVAEMRSQFVSSVSHELKTPLTAIRMFAETLRMGRPADPVLRDEYLDIIVNESERLTRLLNNVLDFTRIESGRKTYQFAPHDLESIVRIAARAMHYPFAQQGFELRVDADTAIPPVRCDPDAIEQAILNLLANALKYSGDARQIELTLARDGADAVIGVRDWGIGIEPADRHRIFDKFYRVARPENRLIPGTGLGLTLVEHIVRSHRGRIDVDSAPGAGSTFRIRLPLAADESAWAEADAVEAAERRSAASEA
jgi:signal transduction histidine kinase